MEKSIWVQVPFRAPLRNAKISYLGSFSRSLVLRRASLEETTNLEHFIRYLGKEKINEESQNYP